MSRVVRGVAVFSIFVASAFGPSAAHAAGVTTWCGGASVVQTDRRPDLLVGNQIDVLYVHPADSPDRFAQLASPIATDIAAVDAWWRKQDPTRTPRFDLFAFPGCTSTYGDLDLADVALPQSSAFYFTLGDRFDRILNALDAPPFNVNDAARKYVIYYDGPISDPNTCGQGGGFSNLYSSGPSWAVIYTQACGLNIGDANHAAHVVTHELIHSLGAVGPGAPHDCPAPNDGHVCDSPLDILYPFLSDTSVFDTEVLDVNRDDYYGNGGQFDIRNSAWLQHLDVPSFALTVSTGGSGTGTVTSDVGAISCPGTCTASFVQGQVVKLTAHPDAGFRLEAWGGACSGRADCTVTVSQASTVTATFGPASRQLSVSVTGRGRVISAPAGIACPGSCSSAFAADSVVAMKAVAAKGYKFAGWSGACRGVSTCVVTVSADTSVGAAFKKKK